MTDVSQLALVVEDWPNAYVSTGCSAGFKTVPEDFQVEELGCDVPVGEGEHLWVWVEKRGANTAWVAGQLARAAGIRERDVGFAGIKDRHAVTRQWFSLYLPTAETPDLTAIEHDEYKVLEQQRHRRKLRRGDLAGNRFVIRLRHISGDLDRLEANLILLQQNGYPNYFGEQRFGHDGGNLEAGMAMLTGKRRVKQPAKKSIYLSAVRSWLFNQVLAERVRQESWATRLEGDPSESVSGPLWGRGRNLSADATLLTEQTVTERCLAVCDALEHAGLSQERRALVVRPEQMSWQWQQNEADGSDLILTFTLGAGYYATSLLRELVLLEQPDRDVSGES